MNLSPEQQLAATSPGPLTVCIAGSGSGKTRVLTERVRFLIASGVSPERIACITFTTKAAGEMQSRIAQPIGFIGTLHQFCLQIVRDNYKPLKLPAQLSVVNDDVAEQVLAEAVALHRYKGTRRGLDAALEWGPWPGVPLEKLRLKEFIVAKEFFRNMCEGGLLTFDTILNCAIKALELGATTPFHCVSIDEFQDASRLDFDVYTRLTTNLFVVGDPRQAIMGFRSPPGSSEYLAELALQARDTGTLFQLHGSYRSGSSIIEAANRLIAADSPLHEPSVSLTGIPGTVTVTEYATDTAELDSVAAHIIYLNVSGVDFNEQAVILCYNVLCDRFRDGLRARGIPVASMTAAETLPGWQLAMTLVSFLGSPNNDRLCLSYLEAFEGVAMAKKLKAQAIEHLTTVAIEAGVQYMAYPTHLNAVLAQCNVPPETQAAVAALLPGCPTPEALLMRLREAQDGDVTGDGVRVLTGHSAKGTQAKIVFCPAWEEGILPSNEKDSGEQRRLAYVMMTRTQEQLFISYARERMPLHGGFRLVEMKPSRFLVESGLSVCHVASGLRTAVKPDAK